MRSGRHREGVHREGVARQRRPVTSSTRAGVCSKRLLGEIALQLDTRILRYVFAPRCRLSQQYTCSSPTAADPPLPHHHYDIPSAGASRLCSRQLVMLNLYLLITAAKEVMFSSAFVCLLALSRIMQEYSTDFRKIRRKGGAWPDEETIRFRS